MNEEPDQNLLGQVTAAQATATQAAATQGTATQGTGWARAAIFGEQEGRILDRLAALDPDLMAYIRDFAYDTVYQRPGLDLKTRELLACTLLVGLGSPPELRTHLRGALRAGATETEVRETLLMCVPYLGFPRVVAAFEQLRLLLEGANTTPPTEQAGDAE